MDDPQIWTLIAVVGALFFGTLGLVGRSLTQTMRAGFDAVDARLTAEIGRLDARLTTETGRLDARLTTEIGRLDAKLDERFDRLSEVMDARFADVDHRLTAIEGDLGLVKGHLIGQRSA